MPTSSLRVVSLLPSATEMVCAVGARDSLVGISHECDFPAGLGGLPTVTSTKLFASASSADIDRDVRRILRDALGVYDVETDLLAELRPDVIVTQDLCDVCAVSYADVERAAREVLGAGVTLVNLRPTRLADIWEDVRRVGRALGCEAEAERHLAVQAARVESVRERAAALPRPRVLTIEWLDPVMIGGTWMPELVELAGGEALVTRPGDHAPTLDLAALRALAPDVVLIKPCGFRLERTLSERGVVDALLAGVDWPAARAGRVFLADGNAYFNRPGPRLVDSLEILAACQHPEVFSDLAEQHAGGFTQVG